MKRKDLKRIKLKCSIYCFFHYWCCCNVPFDGQFKGMGTEPSFGIIFLCIILIIISIYGVAITLSDFILKIVLKNKKIKYSKDNLFIARTFSSKVKTMSFYF